MTDNKVVEFVHDNSQLYFLLGTLSDAYLSLNDLSKRQYINHLEEKALRADNKYKLVLSDYIKALKEAG